MTKFSDGVAHKHFLVGQSEAARVSGGLSAAACTCGLAMPSNGAYAVHLAEVVSREAYTALQAGLVESLLSGRQMSATKRNELVAYRLLVKDLTLEDAWGGMNFYGTL